VSAEHDAFMEQLRAGLERYARRVSVRVAGLSDERACRTVLREEMVRTLKELRLDVDSDPVARARLDWALAEGLAELDRLSEGGAGS
jgi:hypothetical protein